MVTRGQLGVVVFLAISLLPKPAAALIEGGTGNKPLDDPGWPKAAAEVFNNKGRVAYWVGPPLGGGEWHAECRGDANDFNALLVQFAAIEATRRRLVIHDGEGRSFWLNPNNDPAKRTAAAIDWKFVVWQTDAWHRVQSLPPGLRGRQPAGGETPAPQIDVYAGGRIRWADVRIPPGIEVDDQRLEARGYLLTDGTVLEGTVHSLVNGRPIRGATVQLQQIESQKAGYVYTTVAATLTNANGHWVLKSAPAGWHQVVAIADGHAPRVLGYGTFDDQPRWLAFNAGLASSATVQGRVTDDSGKPLSDVEVRLSDVIASGDGLYSSPSEFKTKSDAEGRFTISGAPVGRASVWLHKPGYCRPGLGLAIETPADDVSLSMTPAAVLQVTVDFTGTVRPEAYIVEIEPEGGSKVGSWGGSGHIDADNSITYEQIPPGKYVVRGRPNPGSENQQTDPVKLNLRGGETTRITLKAK